ncbi:MAG: enoyl-CoA hydratase/isomerase family protein [Rhodospirillales bacterium]|nr:MAG: enoyl-CoA hydratase/isomerase family protein [Rhodospirillales bacterium]
MSGAPRYDSILFSLDGDVASITFNRPERRNALTHAMMGEIADALGRVRTSGAVRALVLRGSGGAFCAGGDIGAMRDLPAAPAAGDPDPLYEPYRGFGRTLMELDALAVPVISIVDGPAVGGGFGMACCSDVVILRETARFGVPEPRAGFIPSQVLPFIARRIGAGPLRDLAVTGRVVDAREAYRLGIGRHLCASAMEAEAALAGVLDDLRRNSPPAVAAVKRIARACAVAGDSEVLDAAAHELVALLRRPDTHQGMRAFLDKKLPPWARDGASGERS